MIRELRTFVAVAQEGTFSAAGDKVGLTQAAVSAQMQRLESELGFALFDRSARTARVNARGRQVLEQAQELIRLYSGLGSRRAGGLPLAPVAIGAIASAQRSHLPDVLAKFHKERADVRTRLIPGVSMHLVDQVDAGDIDLAVVIRPPFSLQSDLEWTTLAREPFRLLVPRATAGKDWAQLLGNQPFIRYERASFGGRQVDRFLRGAHLEVREVCELDELEAIVRLVANGVGVALVPETATLRRWPAAIRAIDLGSRTFHRDIGLVHRRKDLLSESARDLAEMICQAYAKAGRRS